MDKPSTLKGFRDFLPEDMALRNEVIKRLKLVFEKYGFQELQTPSLEYAELLLGKYGEDAEKLMYLFRDPGGRNVGLRYDLTVPLARVVSSNPQLLLPFKRFQIQPAWRAENPQRGRYREFYQCDVDIVGSRSPLSDAEILSVIENSLDALAFSDFQIRINSRQVLFGVMEKSVIDQKKWFSVIRIIDKLDKKDKIEVEKELSETGLSQREIGSIFTNLRNSEPDEYLKKTILLAEKMGTKSLTFDPTLARGLDYYTGPIFESVIKTPKIGSITGGGRYDNLLKNLGGADLPAVGTTIGLERTIDVIRELNLIKVTPNQTQVLVTIFSDEFIQKSLSVAQYLRERNINVELYSNESVKLEKQLKYADIKGIPFAIILGPEEDSKGLLTLKNLEDKTQKTISKDDLLKKLKPDH